METRNKLLIVKRMILLSWLLLGICFLIKIFGGNLFEIMLNNEKFIKICSIIDNHKVLRFIVYLISGGITLSLFSLAILEQWKFNRWQLYWVVGSVIVGSFCKAFIGDSIGFIYDCWQFFILPFVLKKKISKRMILIVVIGNILNLGFQMISLVIRNIGFKIITENMLIALIMCIDLYIMLLLYYLYSNYRRILGMGGMFSWFFSKDVAQLEAYKKTLKDEKEIERVQKRIDELKAKENEVKR